MASKLINSAQSQFSFYCMLRSLAHLSDLLHIVRTIGMRISVFKCSPVASRTVPRTSEVVACGLQSSIRPLTNPLFFSFVFVMMKEQFIKSDIWACCATTYCHHNNLNLNWFSLVVGKAALMRGLYISSSKGSWLMNSNEWMKPLSLWWKLISRCQLASKLLFSQLMIP